MDEHFNPTLPPPAPLPQPQQVWVPMPTPVVATPKRRRRRWPWVVGVGLVGLAVYGASQPDEASSDASFGEWAANQVDRLDAISADMDNAKYAADRMDFANAVAFTGQIADGFGDLERDARAHDDGTPLATASIHAFDVCESAWSASASAVSAMNPDAMNSALVLVEDCTASLTDAAALIGG